MHQPDLHPFQSSYFDYEVYPFEPPPELAGTPVRHPVVVVGAGPIGLVLAIQLSLHGVRCVLLESEAQVSGGSRALALTKRSMEIMEQCGVAEAFLQDALLWREGYSFYNNRVVHYLDIPFSPDDKFAPMTNLPQCIMEKILVDRACELGVEIRFQSRVTGMTVADDGVVLEVDTPQGIYRLDADWVVASDGARSTLRRLQGLRFEGRSYESRFVIADFRIALEEPAGRRCYFEPPWLPGHTALMHKAPLGIWRLDYQVPADISDEVALDRERISGQVNAHLAYIGVDLPWEFEWITLYKPNALTLARYRHGRVLYCGDAAHTLPVFGVRGMNTGVQDSINLAWKLAVVVRGHAGVELLDTYSDERVADARQICHDAGRSTRMVAPPTRGFRVMQQAVLGLAQEHEFVRGLLHWRTSKPIDYASSPISIVDPTEVSFAAGPRPGAPARNARLDPARPDAGFLLDAFIAAFHVLVFGSDEALWAAARDDVRALRHEGFAVRLIAIRADGVAPDAADVVLSDPAGHAAALWGAADGAVYVMRPDQHVSARWKPGGSTRVATAIRNALRPAGLPAAASSEEAMS